MSIKLNKKCFPLHLDTRWLSGNWFMLLAPFEYHRRNGEVIRAEKDFKTDFGSKPQIVQSFIGSPTDEAGPAYIIHDWLCVHAKWGRRKTDRIFLEAMRDARVFYIKRMIMFFFVRAWSYF